MALRDHQHAERGDHEVDPRARLLDQEQALAREVAFAGLHRERCACRDAHELRSRSENPPEIVRACIGVVSLQTPGDQGRNGEHDDFRFHGTISGAGLKTRAYITPPRAQEAHVTEQHRDDRSDPQHAGLRATVPAVSYTHLTLAPGERVELTLVA